MANPKTQTDLLARIEELEKENQNLVDAMESKGVTASLPVPGTFKAKNGKTYGFANGHFKIRQPGTGRLLPTVAVLKLAANPKFNPDEAEVRKFPALGGLTHSDAVQLLEFLVKVQYGYLKEVAKAKAKDEDKG